MYYVPYDSPLGPLLLTCTDQGLTGILMNRELPEGRKDHPILAQTAAWLDAYFREDSLPPEIPLAPEGTAFQKQVWKILETIPFGATVSYGDIAREIALLRGKEKMSAQAVGQAVGKNPINILVPCHRVLGGGGRLTGYSCGLEKKIWLLKHEGHKIEKDIVVETRRE